ncbi:MAG TPA: hypothetical protein VFK30_02945, partial [Anaerolineae bacterium]|nr:hypothetical protein [Anaerolineae bacterium]
LPGTQLNVRFEDSLSLISYRLPSTQFVQGGIMPITLYWRAQNGNRSVNVDVNLIDRNGKVIDTSTGPLGPEWYRAPDWQVNEIVATSAALHIPAHLDAGTYRLQVIVRGASNRSLIASGSIERTGFLGLWTEHVTTESDSWILGDVSIVARNRNYNIPAIQHSLPVRFGDQIQLLGYDLNLSGFRLGQPILITFYWQALKAIDQNYVVFTHLLDSNGVQRGQHDSMPNGGLNPTPFWAAGEVIADSYSIPLEADAPAGPYTLDFGWYQSNDGTRLAAIAADGSRYRDDIVSIPGLAINP